MPEFKVLKTDVVSDYMAFVEALNYKFDFDDVSAFEDEFVNLVKGISVDKTYDAGAIMDGFVMLLKKHTNNKDLVINSKLAINELKALGNLNEHSE